ncbi:Endoribonuclease L-PSP/chorismate mutase-like protein [Plectosphaerella cucumerina]|uniref:Endoribonuclease L-PSP/chorismate mutase-like protein n=1 Tax=Plectosphaerella cucumerina TaxID=40658 RepID=A0A8K0X4I6_9PEZI|nr:Endoribonuclease L-PSP/chorismate mutase-like protein [Plectosphaerella cucumerina]
MRFHLLTAALPLLVGQTLAWLQPNYTTSAGVSVYNPGDFFTTTGPWSLMSHAGQTLYIAGMRGIDPATNALAPSGLPRVRQAYKNMAALADMVGVDLENCVRLVVYTTDMFRYRPMCNQIQIELWGNDPNRYPPRTIIEVDRLNDDDIVEVEGTFHAPHLGKGKGKC